MPDTSSRADRSILGVGLAFLSFAVLSGSDTLIKLLSTRYSIFKSATIDAAIAMIVAGGFLARREGFASLVPRRWPIVLVRCLIGAGSLLVAFVGFSRIPLAEAYSISFVAPLLVTALSFPLLGERVGWRQWVAVVVGFAAVVAILRPGLGEIGVGQICALVSAVCFSLSMLMLRMLAGRETSGALLVTYLGVLFLLGLPVAIAEWRTPTLTDFAMMVAMGLFTAFGNLLLIMAFQMAAAALVSSFLYTQLIWGTVFGLLLFGDAPDAITLGGSAIIIACGLYTLSHASRQARMAVT